MRPRLSKKQLTSSPATPQSYTPVPGPKPALRKTRIKVPPLVFISHDKTLVQKHYLPPLPGHGPFVEVLRPHDPITQPPPLPGQPPDDMGFDNNPFVEDLAHHTNPPTTSHHRQKRENQWERWQTTVIPHLIRGYMTLMRETESLREPVPPAQSANCVCGESGRDLGVVIVRFSSLERVTIQICKCQPAPQQLLALGCFPSAPVAPTLAVDLKVLEFVGRLFLNIAPNNTAWCKTVEDFLDSQGYKLTTRDSLRKRFGNALIWYTSLKNATNQHIDNVLTVTREITVDLNDGIRSNNIQIEREDSDPHFSSPQPSLPSSPIGDRGYGKTTEEVEEEELLEVPRLESTRKRQRSPSNVSEAESTEEATNPFPHPPPRERPSDYLRSRCPLCFGGAFPRVLVTGPDAIVCLDACFTQKHNNQAKDPPHSHPRSVFIPEGDANSMQTFVECIRPMKNPPHKRRRGNTPPDEEDDVYEGPLRVPKSALDGCESGFTAADDKRQKASTQFFDDTALMALLCRHDIVLWIVNMHSAGEKQHYALALIETLFQHLPLTFTIGILYDIGCQLHRSCIKWGFLDRHLDRIIFGISVFHAFGHQWPCQLIYHPRKCVGFGLSDGEGCERFWHSISKLIAYLRVCGSYQRIYTLDSQVEYGHTETMSKLGQWLLRRSQHCRSKREVAATALQSCGHSEDFLRLQWSEQVRSQTRPLPRRSKTQGRTAVEATIQLRKARDILLNRIEGLENILIDSTSTIDITLDAETRLTRARSELTGTLSNLRIKEQQLGVNERVQLEQLMNSPFITTRMNARAIKIRLRERLRARKFELERLERSFRKQVNEQKIHAHTETSVKRRDPSIQQLAQNYNKLCDDMARLIRERKAPRGSICPPKIDRKGLFTLDVDDDIWQDIGLEDMDTPTEPPAWLCDDHTREGIKALLEHDRCVEEEERLRAECRSMREWFAEEWNIVITAYENTDSQDLRYQLQRKREHLSQLCVTWQKAVQSLDVGDLPLPSWGPSAEELLAVRVSNVTAAVEDYVPINVTLDGSDSEGEEGEYEEEENADIILLDTLDTIDQVEAFRSSNLDDFMFI